MLRNLFRAILLILLILLLFSGLLLLAGCSCSRRENRVFSSEEIGGFVGGTTGLEVNVLDGAPPRVIPGGGLTSFSFVISLENVGEADVGPGTDNPFVMARLTGIMYNNFGLTNDFSGMGGKASRLEPAAKTLDSKLGAAKKNFDGTILPGEINYVSFENLTYLPEVFETLPLTIRAEVCYDYETLATTKFCIKRDVLESWEDASICTLAGLKPVANSGAPIHVTAVKENPVGKDTVQLDFVIEHVGPGVFFYRSKPKDLFDACVFDDTNPDMYVLEVFVEPVQKNVYDISCLRLDDELPGGGAYGVVRMYGGAPLVLSCFLKRTKPMSTRVYADLLNIKLKYRYGDFLEVPILIQPRP